MVRTFIYIEKNIKSKCIQYLPLGSKIKVKSIEDEWALIHLSDKHIIPFAYVPYKDILSIKSTLKDWVAVAEMLEGTPYKWGGRDTIGIDCSALLQLSYQTSGKIIPRNTNEQVKLKKKTIANTKHLIRGCVIFWEGHVGIMIDKVNCTHANAYHMKTVTEPLIDIIGRMDKDHQIVKMMDFNE